MQAYKEGDKLFLSSHYIPRPNENLMAVLPIDYSERTEEFNQV
jgi:carbon dioxide concentrating mechanism protein CcmK